MYWVPLESVPDSAFHRNGGALQAKNVTTAGVEGPGFRRPHISTLRGLRRPVLLIEEDVISRKSHPRDDRPDICLQGRLDLQRCSVHDPVPEAPKPLLDLRLSEGEQRSLS